MLFHVCALFIRVKKGRGSFRCPERKFGIFYLVISKKNTITNQQCILWILCPFWDKERPIICVNFNSSKRKYVLVKESHYLCISSQTKYSHIKDSHYLCQFYPILTKIWLWKREPLFMHIFSNQIFLYKRESIFVSICLSDPLFMKKIT